MTELTHEDLAVLTRWDTPTICNALEVVAPERRSAGFTTETLVCAVPGLAPMVGFARTATIRSAVPPSRSPEQMRARRLEYYAYVADGRLSAVNGHHRPCCPPPGQPLRTPTPAPPSPGAAP